MEDNRKGDNLTVGSRQGGSLMEDNRQEDNPTEENRKGDNPKEDNRKGDKRGEDKKDLRFHADHYNLHFRTADVDATVMNPQRNVNEWNRHRLQNLHRNQSESEGEMSRNLNATDHEQPQELAAWKTLPSVEEEG